MRCWARSTLRARRSTQRRGSASGCHFGFSDMAAGGEALRPQVERSPPWARYFCDLLPKIGDDSACKPFLFLNGPHASWKNLSFRAAARLHFSHLFSGGGTASQTPSLCVSDICPGRRYLPMSEWRCLRSFFVSVQRVRLRDHSTGYIRLVAVICLVALNFRSE